jgi:signal peptidase II
MAGRELRTPLAIAAVVVLLDQLTKHWALNALADGHVIDLIGSLRFNLAFNRGMAFSQAEGL